MSMKEDSSNDLIGRYLNGKLSPSDLKKFKEMLGTDPELARELDLRRAETAVSELLIASENRNWFREWQAETPSRRGFLRSRPVAWFVGIAAGLLLLFAALRLFQQPPAPPSPAVENEKPLPQSVTSIPPQTSAPESRQLAADAPPESRPILQRSSGYYRALAQNLLPPPVLPNLRRASADSTAGVFRRAQQAYDAGNYPFALDLLADVDSTRLQSATFLKAHTLFHLKRFAEAETQFAHLIEWNSRQFRFQSEWGLLMSRLADFPRRKNEVRKQLNDLLARPEHPYFEQAKTLQQALNE